MANREVEKERNGGVRWGGGRWKREVANKEVEKERNGEER